MTVKYFFSDLPTLDINTSNSHLLGNFMSFSSGFLEYIQRFGNASRVYRFLCAFFGHTQYFVASTSQILDRIINVYDSVDFFHFFMPSGCCRQCIGIYGKLPDEIVSTCMMKSNCVKNNWNECSSYLFSQLQSCIIHG